MRKLLLVARTEYVRMVMRRSFLLATLGIPFFIGIVTVISVIVATSARDDRPLGVVDGAGILGDVASLASSQGISALAFPDEATARAALEGGQVKAFYVVPSDYRTSPRVQLYYWQKAAENDANRKINRLLRAALVTQAPAAMHSRLLAGPIITQQSADGDERGIEKQVLGFLIPLFVGMFFVFVVMGSAGYLLQAVTTEKENRMAEVMFTSLSPLQLIGGKAIGLMGVAFTQIGLWLLALAIALLIAARSVPSFPAIQLELPLMLIVALYFIPTYALVAGIMITLGSMVTDLQQGQQISGMINMLFILPFFFFVLVFTKPDSPLMVALTLFPTTAFMTVAMRWGVTTVPAWQIVVGWSLLVATSALAIAVAARVFRVGMLQYGQALSLRAIAAIVRAPGPR